MKSAELRGHILFMDFIFSVSGTVMSQQFFFNTYFESSAFTLKLATSSIHPFRLLMWCCMWQKWMIKHLFILNRPLVLKTFLKFFTYCYFFLPKLQNVCKKIFKSKSSWWENAFIYNFHLQFSHLVLFKCSIILKLSIFIFILFILTFLMLII